MKSSMSKFAPVIFIIAMSALVFQGCKSKKEVTTIPDETLVEQHCHGPEFMSNNDYFRASAVGESRDQAVSKKKALSNAKANLAGYISTQVKAVIDNYLKDVELNNTSELEERYEGLSREVVNQELTGIRVMCDKLTKTTSGNYKSYVAIELAGDEIMSAMNQRISKDAKLKIDYDYEKFKQTFEDEMNKMEDN